MSLNPAARQGAPKMTIGEAEAPIVAGEPALSKARLEPRRRADIRESAKNYGCALSWRSVDGKGQAVPGTVCRDERRFGREDKRVSGERCRGLRRLGAFKKIPKLRVVAVRRTSIGSFVGCRQTDTADAFRALATIHDFDRDVSGRHAQNHIRKRNAPDEHHHCR